jgi:hypothetical protein
LLNRIARGTGPGPAGARPDVIVAELGDGILGEYGVQDILSDSALMGVAAAHVMAAPDPVACWGAHRLYTDRFHLPITCFTGPATDNQVGRDYIEGQLGLPAHNALRDAGSLVETVRGALRGALDQAAGRQDGRTAGSSADRDTILPSGRPAVWPS